MTTHDSQRVVPGDLLPCPFCDGEPNLQNHPAHGFRAFCDYGADHAVFIGGEDGTEVAAIAAWNRRAPTASPPVAPEDRRDGERYRWLRSQPNDTSVPRIDVVQWIEDDESANAGTGLRMEALDAAIDAAREG